MKQKKYFTLLPLPKGQGQEKKFHKKYVFLQNSLFDFLYWRSFKNFQTKRKNVLSFIDKESSTKAYLFEKKQKFSLLEQEKISFQEYWQISDCQKIKNEIENMNKEFVFLNKTSQEQNEKKYFRDSLLKQKKENANFFSKSEQEMTNPVMKKKPTKNGVNSYKLKKSVCVVQNKKTKHRNRQQFKIYLSSFSKKSADSQNQILSLCTENKRTVQRKFRETLIPKSDCFQKIEKFQFFNNIKLGEFFPKRKDFQQYWIFPLLGFILFFYSNSFRNFHIYSFRDNSGSSSLTFAENQYSNNQNFLNFSFFNTNYQSQKQHNRDFSLNSVTNSQNQKNQIFLKQDDFSAYVHKHGQEQKLQHNLMLNFSYANQTFFDNAFSFQKMETSEFETLTKFYFQKLNNLFISFLLDTKQTRFLQDSFFDKNFLYKTMQFKRNVFNWQWLNLQTTPFFSYENKTNYKSLNTNFHGGSHSSQQQGQQYVPNFYNSLQLHIPQKAQFYETTSIKDFVFSNHFSLNCENSSVLPMPLPFGQGQERKIQKNFQLTPLFHFFKSARFLNDFEKNLFFHNHKDVVQNNEKFSQKNHQIFSFFSQLEKLKYEVTNTEIQFFLEKLKKEKNIHTDFSMSLPCRFLSPRAKQPCPSALLVPLLKPEQEPSYPSPKGRGGARKGNNPKSFSNLLILPTNLDRSQILQKWLQTQSLWNIQKISKWYHTQKSKKFLNKQKKQNFDISSFSDILNKKNNYSVLFESTNLKKFRSNLKKSLNTLDHQKEIVKFLSDSVNTFLPYETVQACQRLDLMYFQKLFHQLARPLQTDNLKIHNFDIKNSRVQKKHLFVDFNVAQKNQTFLKKKLFECYVLKHCKSQYQKNLVTCTWVDACASCPSFSSGTRSAEAQKDRCMRNYSQFDQLQYIFLKKSLKEKIEKQTNKNSQNQFFNKSKQFKENFNKSSLLIYHQLPLFFDYACTYHCPCPSFSSAFLRFAHTRKGKGKCKLQNSFLFSNNLLSNRNVEKIKNKTNEKISSQFFANSWFQTFLLNSQNSPFFSNNFQFFGNHSTSHYFHFGNQSLQLLQHHKPEGDNFVLNFHFLKSKLNSFEKILKTSNMHCFFHISSLHFFKTTFFFEKMKKPQALTFQIQKDSQESKLSQQKFWLFSNSFNNSTKNKVSFFQNSKTLKLQYPKFQTMLKKSSQSLLLKQKDSWFCAARNEKFSFSRNFQSRKFEKIFQMSLSPLNREKVKKSIMFESTKIQKKQTNSFFENAHKSFVLNSKKESIILQNLSKSLQNLYNNSKSSIQIFSDIQNRSKKIDIDSSFSSKKNILFKIPKNDFVQFLEGQEKNTFNTLQSQNQKKQTSFLKENGIFSKNVQSITPNILLKRDGFLFFPFLKEKTQYPYSSLQIFDYSFFSESMNKKQLQMNPQIEKQQIEKQQLFFFNNNQYFPVQQSIKSTSKNQKNVSISNYSKIFVLPLPLPEGPGQGQECKQQKLFFQRFEKEKSFQKKRRLKKQKLETRRRKKRKRFFPRPMWLRFQLYNKFLNTRHPSKFGQIQSRFANNNGTGVSKNYSSNQKKTRENIDLQSTLYKSHLFFPKKTTKNFHLFFMCPLEKNFSKYENLQKNSFLSLKYKKKNLFPFFFYLGDEKNFQKSFQKKFNGLKSNVVIQKKTYESFKNQLYEKNSQKWGFYAQNPFQKKMIVKKFVTNSFVGDFQNKIFPTNNSNSIVSKNIEHYKISGEILREFIRLSWKSYWFQTNFQPYTQQLTQNFQKMKNIEGKKSYSEYNILQFLGNFQFPFLFPNFSTIQNDVSKFQNDEKFLSFANSQFFQNISFRNSSFQNDFLYRKSLFKKFLSYSNIQSSINTNFSQNNPSMFLNVQNIPEYNRILYSRVSELLKNGKALENNEELFGKNMTSFSRCAPKRKNEKMATSNTNFSFFTKVALFSENFCVPSQPEIPAFSLFSALFQDSSIKPTGELPTLRSLWAFQRTNLYHFQETNAIRNVWTLKKRTDSLKNLKGTKQVLNFLRKLRGPEKTNVFGRTNKNLMFSFQKSKVVDSVFASNMQSEFDEFQNQLDSLSWKKFQNVEKKSSLFGIKSLKQNSKLSLRYLKFHLLSKYQLGVPDSFVLPLRACMPLPFCASRTQGQAQKGRSAEGPGHRHERKQNQLHFDEQNSFLYQKTAPTKKPNSMNSAKSSLNYWWAQKNSQMSSFLFSTMNYSNNFVDFEFQPKKSFLSNSFVPETGQNQKVSTRVSFENIGLGKIQFVCFGALLFHLAIFSTVLKIPEIRSVLKFQCLIFYKLLNSFSLLLFSIYHFIKKYIEKIFIIVQFCFSQKKRKQRNFGKIARTNLTFSSFKREKIYMSSFVSAIQEKNLFLARSEQKKRKEQILRVDPKLWKTRKNRDFSCFNKNFLFEFFIRVSEFSSSLAMLEELAPPIRANNCSFPLYKGKGKAKAGPGKQFTKTIDKNNCFDFLLYFQYFLENNKSQKSNFQIKSGKIVVKNKINFHTQNKKFHNILFSSISNNFSNKFKMYLQKQYIFQHKFSQINLKNSVSKFQSFSSVVNLSDPFFMRVQMQKSQKFNYQKNGNFHFSCKKIFIFHKYSKILLPKQMFSLRAISEQRVRKKENFQTSPLFTLFADQENLFEKQVFHVGSLVLQQEARESSKLRVNSLQLSPSTAEKLSSELALYFLIFGKSLTLLSFNFVKIGSGISGTIFNVFEFVMFSIYKFLEKPAELMIEWIALIFLIEWSSDVITFLPDTFDISLWKTSQKFLRPLRSGSLALSIFNASLTSPVSIYQPFSSVNFFQFVNSLSVFTYSNVFSFMVHKRVSYFVENFSYQLTQPDIDILVRQRKGMIFWDIWAEILLKAAEKYNVNIPSFVTLKEEQELFIEKLLQDAQFLKNVRSEKTIEQFQFQNFFQPKNQQSSLPLNIEVIRQNSLMSFIDNFLIKERPYNLSNFETSLHLSKTLRQQIISNNLFSFSFNKWFFQCFQNRTLNFFGDASIQNIDKVLNKQFLHAVQTPFFSNSNTQFFSNFLVQHNPNERWACNQNGISQSPETDLFVDIHPSKSLQHIHYLKYYEPAQYTLGSLICQVYSGLFSKQVSKNILLIGSPGTAKTLFIQALAGETEMKIITDNAYRYSAVQRGVAVGMKYLRDVFDAIALQTPCFFLMEHIHVIGSKRPLLISDDENVKGIQASFGLDQQEVHETNQMIYQSSKHSISDYKRPYKGDFSMGIPTNFFVQNFYSHIEKNSVSIFQNSQFSSGGTYATSRKSPISPLPIDSIENSLLQQNFAQKENSDTKIQTSFVPNRTQNFESRLQLEKEQIFAPPATSPFTVLMMKQQKKLKPKKIVQENSWCGISADQLVSYQKESHSVRAKVAILADITMNLCRGKLDMITDLLVIIDSVRSNRGFVVFATTHVPSSLDPALRRPGRFDETISLAQNTNFFNRFEIFKTYLSNSVSTLDFLDSSMITENLSEIDLFNLITGTKLSLFRQYKFQNSLNSPFQTRIFSYGSPHKALQSFLKSSFFQNFYKKRSILQKENSSHQNVENLPDFSQNTETIAIEKNSQKIAQDSFSNEVKLSSNFFNHNFKKRSFFDLRHPQLLNFTLLPKGPSHILSNAYSKIGSLIIQLNSTNDPISSAPLSLNRTVHPDNRSFLGISLYDSQKQQKTQLMYFLSGKIAEFFVSTGHPVFPISEPISNHKFLSSNFNKISQKNSLQNENICIFENSFELFDRKFSLFSSIEYNNSKSAFPPKTIQKSMNLSLGSQNNNSLEFQKIKLMHCFGSQSSQFSCFKNSYFWSAFGNDESWRGTTSFLSSMIQKRFLFTKNLLLSKMLFFENRNSRKQPPSPPSSSILMPSKKFENFKRTENDFLTKARFSINEKIQFHQQQRFLKQLYNVSVQQSFRSEIVQKRQTFFGNAFQEIAYLDVVTSRSSSIHFYQRKYLGLRHRFSNSNQWWTGLLPEHNTETTYLSDVDWRTMFISRKDEKRNFLREEKQISKKMRVQQSFNQKETEKFSSNVSLTNQTFEFTMDFPDAEQYYNPRNRRWYFNSYFFNNVQQNSSYWLNFDTNLQYEIYYHFLMHSFHETYQYFEKNREMLDFFAFCLLKTGFLKEFDYLTILSRFQKVSV